MSQKTDAEIIEDLGGTYRVAALCGVKPPSVSEWKKTGIPQARRMYLQLLQPEVFNSQRPAANGQAGESVVSNG